jgi:hypothetical protein
MIELPLVFMAGLLGSSHCLGMCGPLVLTLGSSAPSAAANLRRQLAYSVGRIFTYSVLGGIVGYGGARLSAAVPRAVNLPATLAIVAGVFLLYQGLVAAGVLRKRAVAGGQQCLAHGMFATVLSAPGYQAALVAGVFTGLLPCGLLYGMLALAATTQSLWLGMAVMATFAAGTAPIMVLTGWGGSLLSWVRRRQLLRVAAWCLVVTGAITVARGVGYLQLGEETTAAGCPLCAEP